MARSNAELVRSLYEARERDDLQAVRSMLADDVVWREPDLDNPHTGDLRGSEAVLGISGRRSGSRAARFASCPAR